MNMEFGRRDFFRNVGLAASFAAVYGKQAVAQNEGRPNIVWILAEDASPNLGCYGEKTIATPNLDAMARDGVKFNAAFVTCPVCSPCRSAMVTGAYQTTLGIHNHRSQGDSEKRGGNKDYYDSYRLPVKSIPEIFRDAGYHTTLSKKYPFDTFGKTDYNFIWDKEAMYDGADWRERPEGKPFFAQIMLSGGKNRGAKQHATDPAKVTLPPYYADDPVLREDWANYLNSWVQIDVEVKEILESIEEAGVADNTIVFFWTDHGVSHLRGKQFLYEEGSRVPLIVLFPDKRHAGEVREDLVTHIDIAASSLSFAGIPIPGHVQGVDLFSAGYTPRETVFAARDRCDETVDIIRSARAKRYKYIRNFLAHCSHMQPSQYKDGKKITQTMRKLHEEGKLDALQDRIFAPTRPPEELYDLENDPHETKNLAGRMGHKNTLLKMRGALYDWMESSRDVGLIPEPILEDMGRQYGNKYFVLQQEENKTLVRELIAVIEAGERRDGRALRAALDSPKPAVRYWGATGLGNLGDKRTVKYLSWRISDTDAAVRIASALALCKIGESEKYAGTLIEEIDNSNLIAGMYAIRALEISGVANAAARKAVEKAKDNPYEFTRRIAKRLSAKFAERS